MFLLRRAALALVLVFGAGPADAAATVKLAVFPFELDDFSAAMSNGNADPADTAALARVTEDVRKLLQDSGRYAVVEPADAEQSFVGVVKRISRTEYQVHFQLRDAKTGAVIAEADTGLRMGAMDSWNRGAMRLVKDRLLKTPG